MLCTKAGTLTDVLKYQYVGSSSVCVVGFSFVNASLIEKYVLTTASESQAQNLKMLNLWVQVHRLPGSLATNHMPFHNCIDT